MQIQFKEVNATSFQTRFFINSLYPNIPILALLLLSGGFRFLYLNNSPLWLDEIYGYLLAKEGFKGIIINSLADPHPPLYYLIQWVLFLPGAGNSEWIWRWLPALVGTFTVPLVYLLARHSTSEFAALVSAGLLAISPAHIYYSQEARSTALLTFLAALSFLLTIRIIQDDKVSGETKNRLWVALALVSLTGLFSSYSYALVVGIQGIYLSIFHFKKLNFQMYAASLAAGIIGLAPFSGSLIRTNELHQTGSILGISRLLQSLLAGEPLRYGLEWPHFVLPIILSTLALLGSFRLLSHQNRPGSYLVLQTILPVALFFAVAAPLLGFRLPIGEAKQFMVLLPSFLVMVAKGFDCLPDLLGKRIGWTASIVLIIATSLGSFHSLGKYWTITKSPEGLAVLYSRQFFMESDGAISLHYSTSAALDFYIPEAQVYTYPQKEENGYSFSTDLAVLHLPHSSQNAAERPHLQEVQLHSRLWVYSIVNSNHQLIEDLASGCTITERHTFFPFEVLLIEECGQIDNNH